MFKKFKLNKPLLAIFFLALGLRLFGIWHGWPFIYNVDEPALVRSAVGIRFAANPGHFDWPHLHFYLSFGVLAFFYLVRGFSQMAGLRPILEPLIGFFWQDPAVYYLIVRVFNACLGALTVVPVYLAGKVLFAGCGGEGKELSFKDLSQSLAPGNSPPEVLEPGPRVLEPDSFPRRPCHLAGLLAALALAVIPFHVKDSHIATIDVPMVFWLAWSLYFSARILRDGRRKNYIWAGVFAGLAASTKYNGILVLVCVGVAHVLRLPRLAGQFPRARLLGPSFGKRKSLALGLQSRALFLGRLLLSRESLKPITSVLIAILVFFIGTPFALFDFDTFWSFEYPKGVLWQFLNVGQVGSWAALWANAQKVLWKEFFPRDFSLPFWLVVLWSFLELVFGIIGVIREKVYDRGDRGNRSGGLGKLVFLWFFPIVYLVLVIRGVKFSSHYFLPIYPFVALLVGRCTAGIVTKIGCHSELGSESKLQNSKSEALDSKQYQMTKTKNSKRFEYLKIWILDLFRISDLGFRICGRVAVPVFLFLTFGPSFYSSLQQDLIYARADTRTLASRWVDENVPAGSVGVIAGGIEDIILIKDGVTEDHFKDLSVIDDFDKYNFVIVARLDSEYAKEKLTGKGFELAQEIFPTNPTRRGPNILIFQKIL